MPANESEIVTAAPAVVNMDDEIRTLGRVTIGTLYFMACFFVTPIGFLAFSCFILKLLMERLHPPTAAITDDPSVYRRFIRPVGRTLVLIPFALMISVALVGLGFMAIAYIGPLTLLLIPAIMVRFLIKKKMKNQLARGCQFQSATCAVSKRRV
ncbi:MAG: hypothetical protein JST01_20775 [Cyanobacteria bacterium SZAS TMP-1]|nr:hypothetical protein [Cyanobacteria bacterium SZAS TMP-1]